MKCEDKKKQLQHKQNKRLVMRKGEAQVCPGLENSNNNNNNKH